MLNSIALSFTVQYSRSASAVIIHSHCGRPSYSTSCQPRVPRVNWIRRVLAGCGRYSARKIFFPCHPVNMSAVAALLLLLDGWNESITARRRCLRRRRLSAGSSEPVTDSIQRRGLVDSLTWLAFGSVDRCRVHLEAKSVVIACGTQYTRCPQLNAASELFVIRTTAGLMAHSLVLKQSWPDSLRGCC